MMKMKINIEVIMMMMSSYPYREKDSALAAWKSDLQARKCYQTLDIFQPFSVNVQMLSTLSGYCVYLLKGCHCSGDRFVVCHFLLLIR